jgi:hypothetical protein
VCCCRSKLDSLTFFIQRSTLDVAKPLIIFEAKTLELVLRFLDIKYFRLEMPSGRRVVFGTGFLIVIHDQDLPIDRERCVYMYTTILTVGALTEYVCAFSESKSATHLQPSDLNHLLDGTAPEMQTLWNYWSVA